MMLRILYIYCFILSIQGCRSFEEKYIHLFGLDRILVMTDTVTQQIDSMIYLDGYLNRMISYSGAYLLRDCTYDKQGNIRRDLVYPDAGIFGKASYYGEKGELDSTQDYLNNFAYGDFRYYYPNGKLRLYRLVDMSRYILSPPLWSMWDMSMEFDDTSENKPIGTYMYPFTPFMFSVDRHTRQVMYTSWRPAVDSTIEYLSSTDVRIFKEIKIINGEHYAKVPKNYRDLYITVFNVFNTPISLKLTINNKDYQFENPGTHTFIVKDALLDKGIYDIKVKATYYFLHNSEKLKMGGYQFEEYLYKE